VVVEVKKKSKLRIGTLNRGMPVTHITLMAFDTVESGCAKKCPFAQAHVIGTRMVS
jgi:hypothetical protein